MKMPSMFVPGEVCWVGVRHPLEDPSSATGPTKLRPAILVGKVGRSADATDDRWAVVGVTTNTTFADGRPRTAVPAHLWGPGSQLGSRAYLWSNRCPIVNASDIAEHIQWATPELRAFVVAGIVNLSRAVRNDFLRLRPDELAEIRTGRPGPLRRAA